MCRLSSGIIIIATMRETASVLVGDRSKEQAAKAHRFRRNQRLKLRSVQEDAALMCIKEALSLI
jgi:hypothetical protein